MAAGEGVCDAVGGGDVGAIRGEYVQLGVSRAGWLARCAAGCQDEPVVSGQHGMNFVKFQGGLEVGQEEHPAGDFGWGHDRCAGCVRGIRGVLWDRFVISVDSGMCQLVAGALGTLLGYNVGGVAVVVHADSEPVAELFPAGDKGR